MHESKGKSFPQSLGSGHRGAPGTSRAVLKLLPTAQVSRPLARSDFKRQDPWEETHVNHSRSVQSDDGGRREPPAAVRTRRVTPRGSPKKMLRGQALDLAPRRKGTGQRGARCRSAVLRKQVSRDTRAL